eukprot:CAMPEP_0172722584 /NCGR_PEP_ID=MMETSP1074-20121228/81846_1 /TAXON_ID=2916 /ORGANISM="Ceratium fusus, Strain PA161109" /LENGTH=296 /DNA_ID=CAMNT_0013548629 /DNA_START=205 /DNA_END=1095 /DNA_ORIENTATION=+
MYGEPPQDLVFRFSEVHRLSQTLSTMIDLKDILLPALPPKTTLRSLMKGNFDAEFLDQRQAMMQEFFDNLAGKLNRKYGAIGNVLDLCEPLGIFVRQSAAVASAADHATVQAIESASRLEEDRAIIATQEREYEESLQIDELRRVAEVERQEQEERERREEAERAEAEAVAAAEAARAAADAAAQLAADVQRRRAAFELAHAEPTDSTAAQATVRLRAASGATVQRRFLDSTAVGALFEFAVVADWQGPAADSKFDLRTSFPARSLRGLEQQTLREAGLCPSAALLVGEVDDAADA